MRTEQEHILARQKAMFHDRDRARLQLKNSAQLAALTSNLGVAAAKRKAQIGSLNTVGEVQELQNDKLSDLLNISDELLPRLGPQQAFRGITDNSSQVDPFTGEPTIAPVIEANPTHLIDRNLDPGLAPVLKDDPSRELTEAERVASANFLSTQATSVGNQALIEPEVINEEIRLLGASLGLKEDQLPSTTTALPKEQVTALLSQIGQNARSITEETGRAARLDRRLQQRSSDLDKSAKAARNLATLRGEISLNTRQRVLDLKAKIQAARDAGLESARMREIREKATVKSNHIAEQLEAKLEAIHVKGELTSREREKDRKARTALQVLKGTQKITAEGGGR